MSSQDKEDVLMMANASAANRFLVVIPRDCLSTQGFIIYLLYAVFYFMTSSKRTGHEGWVVWCLAHICYVMLAVRLFCLLRKER